jgi:uncharacterized protein (DUF488 family)
VRTYLFNLGVRYDWYPNLAPSWDTMVSPYKSGIITKEVYIERYNHQLHKLNPQQVVDELTEEATLLCYELPHQFCHRHLVSQWLTNHGYDIVEYIPISKMAETLESEFIF